MDVDLLAYNSIQDRVDEPDSDNEYYDAIDHAPGERADLVRDGANHYSTPWMICLRGCFVNVFGWLFCHA